MNAKEIRELFQKHGLEVSRSDIWEIQGNPVIHHKAVERLGVMIGIEWHQPKILRAEKDEAVMIVTGKVGERLEWSIGEAAIGQNYRVSGKQAAYVFCMAEKRGRDRVILKLAGLHGAYSEEEADDFKQDHRGEYIEGPPHKPDPIEGYHPPSKDTYIKKSISRIADFDDAAELLNWAMVERRKVWPQYGIEGHDPDGQLIVAAYKGRIGVLEAKKKAA